LVYVGYFGLCWFILGYFGLFWVCLGFFFSFLIPTHCSLASAIPDVGQLMLASFVASALNFAQSLSKENTWYFSNYYI
jgi:hypothetical protein